MAQITSIKVEQERKKAAADILEDQLNRKDDEIEILKSKIKEIKIDKKGIAERDNKILDLEQKIKEYQNDIDQMKENILQL